MKIAVIGSRNLTVNDLGQYLPGEVKPWRHIRTRFWMEYFPNLFAEKPYHTSV